MSVGKRIRALRIMRGISNQEELAWLVGTARQTVSSWERDIFLPDSENLKKLAEALKTSVAYIIGETDEMLPLSGFAGGKQAAPSPGTGRKYELRAEFTAEPSVSFELKDAGRTIRYDLTHKQTSEALPLVERLWQQILRIAERSE